MAATSTGLRFCIAFCLLLLGCSFALAQQVIVERESPLLAEPRADAPVVATLKQGTTAQQTGKQGAWLNVTTDSGSGWLLSFNVRFGSGQASASGSGAGAGVGRLFAPSRKPTVSHDRHTRPRRRGLEARQLRRAANEPLGQVRSEQAGRRERGARVGTHCSTARVFQVMPFQGRASTSGAKPMNKIGLHLAAATLFALAFAAQGASFDLNRIFGVGKDLATATTGIDEKEEIVIGQELAGRTLGAAPLVNAPALQTYINRVGRWVASQSERPDLPWHFGVINTSSINAFAIPGGYVLITRGLYDLLDNESQLGGVLGHEIAHIVKRHHISVMQKQAGVSAVTGAAQEALASRGGRSAALNNLLGTGAEVLARGLDKDAEFESDNLGVVLAARAGYSPYGLVEFLHKLQARGANDKELSLLFSTHPSPGDRLEKLGEAMTPRVATLPAGKEPQIRAVGANVAASPAAPVAPAGASALQENQRVNPGTIGTGQGSRGGSGGGLDAGNIFRNIFGPR